jgi:hypothetical protein
MSLLIAAGAEAIGLSHETLARALFRGPPDRCRRPAPIPPGGPGRSGRGRDRADKTRHRHRGRTAADGDGALALCAALVGIARSAYAIERLTREKAELVAALRSPLHVGLVEASIRQFCASARARFEACADFDAKRQFLVDHVERLIYNRYKVAIAGSVAVESASGESKLQFRIEGEIDGRRYVRGRDRYVRKLGGGRSAGASRSCNSAQTKRSAAFRAL